MSGSQIWTLLHENFLSEVVAGFPVIRRRTHIHSSAAYERIYIPREDEEQISCTHPLLPGLTYTFLHETKTKFYLQIYLFGRARLCQHIYIPQWRRRFKTFSRYEHTTRTFLWRSFTLRTVHVFIFIRLYLRLGCTVNVITFIRLYSLFVRAVDVFMFIPVLLLTWLYG